MCFFEPSNISPYGSPTIFPVSPTFLFFFVRKGRTFAADMNKKVFFLWLAVAAAVAVLMGCQNNAGEQNSAVKSFETMTVSKQDITFLQTYPAQV